MIEDVPTPDAPVEQPAAEVTQPIIDGVPGAEIPAPQPTAEVPAPEVIDSVPGMEPSSDPAPSRGTIPIENPGPQTIRTAINTPYQEVAPGTYVDTSAPQPEATPPADTEAH